MGEGAEAWSMGRWRVLLFLLGSGGVFLSLSAISRNAGTKGDGGGSDTAGTLRTEEKTSAKDSKSALRALAPREASQTRLLEALGSTDPAEHTLALETLIPELIRRDSHGAMELLARLEPWERREQALLVASREFGADPQVTIAWLAKLQDQAERSICRSAACQRMIGVAPEAALGIAGSDDQLLTELAAAYVARAPREGFDWIANNFAREKRDRLLAAGIQALADSSPEEAATLAVAKIEDPSLQEEAVMSALHQWVIRDRKAAAAWVELFPEGPLRERAEGELFGTR